MRKGEALAPFLRKLGIELPIIQAPMAGVSPPEMAAAVLNAAIVIVSRHFIAFVDFAIGHFLARLGADQDGDEL